MLLTILILFLNIEWCSLITKIVPPLEKNKELFYLFFNHLFYYEQAFVIAML